MKTRLSLALAAASLAVLPAAAAAATGVLVADTHVSSAQSRLNFGSFPQMAVDTNSSAFLRFDLSRLPPGTRGSTIARATLRLYVTRVTAPAIAEIRAVDGRWTESTLNYTSRPATQAPFALPGNLPPITIAAAAGGQWVLADVTPLVQAWLAGTPNRGFAVIGSSGGMLLSSKEGAATGHPAELEISLKTRRVPRGRSVMPVHRVLLAQGQASPIGAPRPRRFATQRRESLFSPIRGEGDAPPASAG